MNGSTATVRRLDLYRVTLPLATSLAHSQVATDLLDQLFLVLTLEDSTQGISEVRGNGAYATGHDAASVHAALAASAKALLGRAACLAGPTVLAQTGNRLATALVEMASLDALARRAGLPLWRYLVDGALGVQNEASALGTGRRLRCPQSAIVGATLASPGSRETPAPFPEATSKDPSIVPPQMETHASMAFMAPHDAAVRARQAAAAGFRRFKLRVGSPCPDADVARVEAVRDAAPDASLVIDANGGWSAAEAIARAERLRPFGIAWLEQPIPPGDDAALRAVRERAGMKIVADESIRTSEDIRRLAAASAIDGVHLKMEKCGTLEELRAAVGLAREAGLLVEIGMMDQGRLGSATIAAIASTLTADAYELWGFERVARDVAHGLEIAGGTIGLSALPGNGMTVDLQEAARVATWA